MRVISGKALVKFWERWPAARLPMMEWHRISCGRIGEIAGRESYVWSDRPSEGAKRKYGADL